MWSSLHYIAPKSEVKRSVLDWPYIEVEIRRAMNPLTLLSFGMYGHYCHQNGHQSHCSVEVWIQDLSDSFYSSTEKQPQNGMDARFRRSMDFTLMLKIRHPAGVNLRRDALVNYANGIP